MFKKGCYVQLLPLYKNHEEVLGVRIQVLDYCSKEKQILIRDKDGGEYWYYTNGWFEVIE